MFRSAEIEKRVRVFDLAAVTSTRSPSASAGRRIML